MRQQCTLFQLVNSKLKGPRVQELNSQPSCCEGLWNLKLWSKNSRPWFFCAVMASRLIHSLNSAFRRYEYKWFSIRVHIFDSGDTPSHWPNTVIENWWMHLWFGTTIHHGRAIPVIFFLFCHTSWHAGPGRALINHASLCFSLWTVHPSLFIELQVKRCSLDSSLS